MLSRDTLHCQRQLYWRGVYWHALVHFRKLAAEANLSKRPELTACNQPKRVADLASFDRTATGALTTGAPVDALHAALPGAKS